MVLVRHFRKSACFRVGENRTEFHDEAGGFQQFPGATSGTFVTGPEDDL